MGHFENVELAPPDPILGITTAFNQDPRQEKIDLSVGIYRNSDLQAEIMEAVKQAETLLLQEETEKTYLPIQGLGGEIDGLMELVFGTEFFHAERGRIAGVQGLGGTGSIRIGLDYLKSLFAMKAYVSDPTWANHNKLVRAAHLELFQYPYYDRKKSAIAFDEMVEFFKKVPEKSVVILHGCCHNPTGADLSRDQWKALSTLFLERRLFPFFDIAYQGFGEGLNEDAWAIRHFASEGHEMAVAQSCSKNFGLYGERVGALFIVTERKGEGPKVLSQLKPIIRANYSNPPMHGATLVAKILDTSDLKQLWEKELTAMRARITKMRKRLTEELMKVQCRKDFSFLSDRKGLFSFTGLRPEQSQRLIEEHAIYLTQSGRINICGLCDENVPRIARAIAEVLE